jgi:hypothetical protein
MLLDLVRLRFVLMSLVKVVLMLRRVVAVVADALSHGAEAPQEDLLLS